MKLYKIIPAAALVCGMAACTSGNGNKAEQKSPDTVRTDTSALHGTNSVNDSTSRHIDSTKNQNASPTGGSK